MRECMESSVLNSFNWTKKTVFRKEIGSRDMFTEGDEYTIV